MIELTEMSIKIKEWLRRLGIDTTHEEREEIDRATDRTILRPRSRIAHRSRVLDHR